MDKTKIEWAEATWNPVTGCLHGCEYCYARRIAERFKGCDSGSTYGPYHQATWRCINKGCPKGKGIFEIDTKCPPINVRFDPKTQRAVHTKAPYPWGFQPTLHRDRLDIPMRWTKPRTIFVCSMADLFGAWVPFHWIKDVLDACERAPQHRYLFLTKNPERYKELNYMALLPHGENFWYGTSVTSNAAAIQYHGNLEGYINTFWSMEPLLGLVDMSEANGVPGWVILGAETGNRRDKVRPRKGWIDSIVAFCDAHGVPVFMKDSLIPLVGVENMRGDFPWVKEETK